MEKILSALAEQNRIKIIELLKTKPLTVGEIADKLQLRQPQASKHLKVLHDAGIVEVLPRANRRIYKLRPEPFQDLDAWLDSFKSIWEDRLDQLDDYLNELQKKERNNDD
ncbi:DNA-binding transcriptional regulator, ArsR family [Thalassobacillus cyri]|uniref:DNA-binding transcriptional regulator, ArsR family n=1 Tax=Thalassobacillus cyri TaxID=571932 RepID=A0A1H4G843_9BACI|nr:metalloregulator ArsR/SmtB family transcription factor [Thalassobacillus cyri]SEB05724.1 DNA-binding transcriptional regulator, ArsR family [Thalassobacillus cyri]